MVLGVASVKFVGFSLGLPLNKTSLLFNEIVIV